jgi:hypothetical protein
MHQKAPSTKENVIPLPKEQQSAEQVKVKQAVYP